MPSTLSAQLNLPFARSTPLNSAPLASLAVTLALVVRAASWLDALFGPTQASPLNGPRGGHILCFLKALVMVSKFEKRDSQDRVGCSPPIRDTRTYRNTRTYARSVVAARIGCHTIAEPNGSFKL